MMLTVILGIVTLVLSVVATYGLRLPGMDLTPVGVIMIASAGENALIGAIVLTIAYKFPKPSRLMWVWVQVPVAWLTAWLAVTFDAVMMPILAYYIMSLGFGIISQTIGGRYYMSVAFGLALNLMVGRIYSYWG